MSPLFDAFAEVWAVDTEFRGPPGGRPEPVCLVAHGLRSGRRVRLWADDLRRLPVPPYGVGPDQLFLAYHAPAELGCHLALGWPLPARVLDLCAEFKGMASGRVVPCGKDLLGAMAAFGLNGMAAAEKAAMRDLVLRGGPWGEAERADILDYCESDVRALGELLPAMAPHLDLPRALLRGRYTAAVARMEWAGVPVDAGALARLRAGWAGIQDALIKRIDAGRGIYEGRTFKADRWASWLAGQGIPWPRLESGALALDDDTFREMARAYPAVAPVRELRHALSQLRLEELAVGPDGRNRTPLWPFASKTGRNQPSNTRFIFGPSVWLRSLIRPGPGTAVAYVDWSQQEFGIAAALSGDPAMKAAYVSGDPYLKFAVQAGAAPADATKASHGAVREVFKACALGVQYGMGEQALARRVGTTPAEARNLLRLHRQTYPRFWAWSDAAVDHAGLHGRLHTVFGWPVHTGAEMNPRSVRNFPMQANGAEMLRLACCTATEAGLTVCAPVHDAVLVEGAAERIGEVVGAMQTHMAEASALVLGGFRLRTDATVVRHPDRYADGRGKAMWETVQELLGRADPPANPSPGSVPPAD